MTRVLFASILGLSFALPAFAQTSTSTGGPSGGPNQAQSVVPSGATGGPAGAPNQSKFVKKSHKTKKHMHKHS